MRLAGLTTIAFSLLVAGCGDDPVTEHVLESDGGHVWEEQVSTIDEARKVEGVLSAAAAARRQD